MYDIVQFSARKRFILIRYRRNGQRRWRWQPYDFPVWRSPNQIRVPQEWFTYHG